MADFEFTPKTIKSFMSRVQVDPSGCWIWTGVIRHDGYGSFWVAGKTRLAHRLSFFIHRGEIPDGLVLDHLCRNRACVNPDHLEPVTDHINILRGDSPAALSVRTNCCKRGHEYTPENTYIRPDLYRFCRECARERDRERRKRQGTRSKDRGYNWRTNRFVEGKPS